MVGMSGEGRTAKKAPDLYANEGCRASLHIEQLKRFQTPLFCHHEFVLTIDVLGLTVEECS
jgi:hypothetical protein